MRAFEVLHNGQHVCTIGIGSDGMLAVKANWIALRDGDSAGVVMSGFDGPTEERARWPPFSLTLGDEVTIRYLESDAVDPPFERKPRERLEDRQSKD